EAFRKALPMSHHRHAVQAAGAPAPAGPYSHAVESNGLLFCSGQVPLDADSGSLVEGEIGDRTRKCLENLEAVCAAAGTSLDHAVRCTIYVTDMGQFGAVNEAYGAYFRADPPARVTVGVAALPLGADVEIEAVVAVS
ncbi:MAG TPA: Rid family detoxifying hydrolase, partial [Solirubrobacteraceae bacterium]